LPRREAISLERLAQYYTRAIVAETAQEYGVHVDGRLEDSRHFFAMPAAGVRGDDDMGCILHEGGVAIRSYREGGTIMHDHRRRLERLDWQHIRQLAAEAGQPFGFTADDILEEARRIFALPEAVQRRELHASCTGSLTS
jgi:hypothetical protein